MGWLSLYDGLLRAPTVLIIGCKDEEWDAELKETLPRCCSALGCMASANRGEQSSGTLPLLVVADRLRLIYVLLPIGRDVSVLIVDVTETKIHF